MSTRKLLLCSAALALASLAPAFAEDAGQKEFVAQKCNKCHDVQAFEIKATVTSEKIKGPDLSTVGDERDAGWMTKWVLKEVQLDGKNHAGKWEGSKKQLETIVNWLASLKKK